MHFCESEEELIKRRALKNKKESEMQGEIKK